MSKSDTTIGHTADPLGRDAPPAVQRPNLSARTGIWGSIVFIGLLVAGVVIVVQGLVSDLAASAAEPRAIGTLLLLGIALLIALGFEFVNGFHDTANAVATVIYTNSMPAQLAVVWSGLFNFLGVLTSSGAVAWSVVTLLPVELILGAGSGAGFAMIFALLIASMVWNLGTWWLGLPASSSHTLIGSIMGVGIANQLMAGPGSGVAGVDWSQAGGVFRALLFSPLVGFAGAALLLLAMKALVRTPALYTAPEGNKPPPLGIRAILVLTCTGVSFAHGSNDGQKGMGLIMLILIGTFATAYALNRTVPDSEMPAFAAASEQIEVMFIQRAEGRPLPQVEAARAQVTDALKLREPATPETYAALATLTHDIANQVAQYGAVHHVPTGMVQNIRNSMFLVAESVRIAQRSGTLMTPNEAASVGAYRTALDRSTKFIPIWVKIVTALALGLGTMVGWKRIVITVGEKIGKTHMNYAQGAAAELVAALTIAGADLYGLPVSTTHVLSSGVAGSMAASGAGLQWGTVRSMALAWVLTLPAAIMLSGVLYYVFSAQV
ncbi:MAG TPA: inorganic phosphate transporter [Acetobacteraceae bacterium]|jgi:PiT family inorganic phosphate transporter|nr:inorganic phosphate transporter [Acetobacteraceae bacterium]